MQLNIKIVLFEVIMFNKICVVIVMMHLPEILNVRTQNVLVIALFTILFLKSPRARISLFLFPPYLLAACYHWRKDIFAKYFWELQNCLQQPFNLLMLKCIFLHSLFLFNFLSLFEMMTFFSVVFVWYPWLVFLK